MAQKSSSSESDELRAGVERVRRLRFFDGASIYLFFWSFFASLSASHQIYVVNCVYFKRTQNGGFHCLSTSFSDFLTRASCFREPTLFNALRINSHIVVDSQKTHEKIMKNTKRTKEKSAILQITRECDSSVAHNSPISPNKIKNRSEKRWIQRCL